MHQSYRNVRLTSQNHTFISKLEYIYIYIFVNLQIARMINRYHQELQQKEIRAEKEEGMRLKRIAGNLAKMVKEFWNNVEKVLLKVTTMAN